MDLPSATLSQRRGRYYVSMTIPQEVRQAFGGQKQLRLSTGTSDKAIAEKRRFELEAQLRERILRVRHVQSLRSVDSAYQTAVRKLRLYDTGYDFPYDQEIGDVVTRAMPDPPEDAYQARKAIAEFKKVLLELQGFALSPQDSGQLVKMWKRFDGEIPDLEEAQRLISAAERELDRSFGSGEASATVSGYLPGFEQALNVRVANKDLKAKTAKARIKNIQQFIDVVGDNELIAVQAKDAYDFAKRLAEQGCSNSTVKTRVSDVSTMLDAAVQDGLLSQNPFSNLKLSRIGKKGQHYTPLSDDQLVALFSIPKLPREVRDLWAILVCSGMRLDEVALCKTHQVREQDGLFYFDLRNADVKNRQSQRQVPVCETLIPLIKRLLKERTGRERLFDFPVKSDGKSRASEKCGFWMKKVDLGKVSGEVAGRYTNHSMRGSFKDKMRNAGVALEVHNAILGHDQHTVGAAYGHGPSLAVMKAAVDLAAHPYLSWISEECMEG
ncbi:tyrosine-type recombinase/integrase [Yangia mangrovi]|uniref:Tyrosine-type recombinase/integrase n=2 Tax=Alloyangia mangrovi TaxID=1779329 RepID=A0ABT2KQZ6_9RHOB|nr:DUF6538 domain-containing protein [Alloyangia mangrovi]MCT4373261.1 tyrosine-type recombinase/integrase [Alloyangia mangrovi]